jgi:hypothetical protein
MAEFKPGQIRVVLAAAAFAGTIAVVLLALRIAGIVSLPAAIPLLLLVSAVCLVATAAITKARMGRENGSDPS